MKILINVLLAACLANVLGAMDAVPFTTHDIVTAANFTDQELCYIRLYGVGLRDANNKRAYGLKFSFDVETIALMAEPSFAGDIGGKDVFLDVISRSDLHNYNSTKDYCNELAYLLTRKAKIRKEIWEKRLANQNGL